MTQETCEKCDGTAYFHLPGLFEFYGLYSLFLPLFYNHREYFYDWCEIGSIYGAPADCLWGGGRVGFGDDEAEKVLRLTQKYGISARLTFSNSLIKQEHLFGQLLFIFVNGNNITFRVKIARVDTFV